MKATPLISVIVPIYQVEAYLEECLDSILNQTYRQLEIILVDDGSPDRCGEICDRYASQDSRIQVIHQTNQGLSAARNAGMDIATGEYISFIDSDDYIDSHFYEKMEQGFQDYPEAPIITCLAYQNEEGYITPYTHKNTNQPKFHSTLTFCEDCILGKMSVVVWNKLFRSELMKDIRFRVGRIFEDSLFMHDLSPILKQYPGDVVVIPHYLYYYRIRQGSICHGEEPNIIGSLHSYLDIITESKEQNPEFAQKLEIQCQQNIINFNGQLELNKEWKKKYAPTFRPLMKQIPWRIIFSFQASWKGKIAMLIIRLYPAAYPVLRKIKEELSYILYRHK